MRKVIVFAAVWWLMTGWGFSSESKVIGGPFQTFAQCENAGNHLPFRYYKDEWHCNDN